MAGIFSELNCFHSSPLVRIIIIMIIIIIVIIYICLSIYSIYLSDNNNKVTMLNHKKIKEQTTPHDIAPPPFHSQTIRSALASGREVRVSRDNFPSKPVKASCMQAASTTVICCNGTPATPSLFQASKWFVKPSILRLSGSHFLSLSLATWVSADKVT